MYELYAMVEHVGNLKNGHYTALIKSQDDDKWYNFNDSSVTLVRVTAPPTDYMVLCKFTLKAFILFIVFSQPDFQPFQVDPTDR